MRVEVKNRQVDNQFLATFLVASGMVGVRQTSEQKLLLAPKEEIILGFNPKKEAEFIARVGGYGNQKEMLGRDVSTQLAEDFGLLKHVAWYEWKNGEIVIPNLGNLEEVTWRRGVGSEIEAVKRIQEKLNKNPNSVVLHMSPVNERLGYKDKCVDFWRIVDGKVNSIRIMVVEDEEAMRKVWKMLNGGKDLENGEDLLANPIESGLNLAELLNLFELAEKKNDLRYQRIEKLVLQMMPKLEKEYGLEIVRDPELILRLYSATYMILEEETDNGNELFDGNYIKIQRDLGRRLDFMMTAKMDGTKIKPSSGCSSSTSVGAFASEGMIIIVTAEGISFRKGSTEGLTYCSKCGCWYSGDSCPICK